MAGFEDLFPKVKSMFNAGDMSDPRVNPEVRKRIALQLMTQNQPYAKNVGEGLASFGKSIGNRRAADQMAADDIAEMARAKQALPDPYGAGAPPVAASTPPVAASPVAGGAGTPAGAVNTAVLPPPPPSAGGDAVAAIPQTAGATRSMGDPAALPAPNAAEAGAVYQPGTPIPATGNRTREAVTRAAMQAAGGPQPNPTQGVETPPLGTDLAAAGGDSTEFSSQNRPRVQAAPPDPRAQIRRIPTVEKPDYDYVTPDTGFKPAPQLERMGDQERRLRVMELENPGSYTAQRAKAGADYLEGQRTQKYNSAKQLWEEEAKLVLQQKRQREDSLKDAKKRGTEGIIQEQDIISRDPSNRPPVPAEVAGRAPILGAPVDYDYSLGTAQSPQRIGVPTAGQVPPGLSAKQWSEQMKVELPKATEAVRVATPEFKIMLNLLKEAREHPGKAGGVGAMGNAAGYVWGTPQYGFAKLMEQIGGRNFLAVYQKLKGGGPITEIEGTKAEAAQARLSRAQNEKDFNKALLDFEEIVRTDFDTTQRRVNQPVTAWQTKNEDPEAPDRGEIKVFPDGRTRQYVGGNPHRLNDSWKVIR